MIKKGFTLVELLGVIVVLGIILVVTVPSVIDTLRRSNANENAAYLTRLYTGAETYLEMNRESYDQLDAIGGRVDIPIQTLMDEGLVKTLGTNPDTGSMILASHTVTATKQADGTIAYAIYANNTNIKSYVQSGLILQLDAINNVAFGHSNTSTVWNDLSTSKNDFNNVNPAKWTNRALTFTALADVLTSKNMITATTLGKDVTFEILLKETAHQYVQIGMADGVMLKLRIVGNNPWWNAYPVTIQSYSSDNALNTMTRFAYRNNFTGGVADKWMDAAKTSVTVSNLAAVDRFFQIGTTEYLAGEIYTIRVYNRALSDGEIQSNYQLDLYRYR